MKKFFKMVFILFIIAITGVVGFTTYKFNTYTPLPVTLAADSKNLIYFQNSYEDCREKFIMSANKIIKKYKNVTVSKLKVESKKDPDLTIDYCSLINNKVKNYGLIYYKQIESSLAV